MFVSVAAGSTVDVTAEGFVVVGSVAVGSVVLSAAVAAAGSV